MSAVKVEELRKSAGRLQKENFIFGAIEQK
jgi:hypothetical protein